MRYVAQRLGEDGATWFQPKGNEWHISLDRLKESFAALKEIDWLSGTVICDPDYEHREHDAFGHPSPRGILQIRLERDCIQDLVETPERQRERLFDELTFHPSIAETCRERFASGMYQDAILFGCMRVSDAVRARTGIKDDGDMLFATAFKADAPALKFNSLSAKDDKNEQRGYMLLFQAMWATMRNPSAHRFLSLDEHVALEQLAFLSMLMRCLDAAVS